MFGLGLLIVRLAVGLTIAAHGAQKLFGWFQGPRIAGFSAMLEKMGIRPSKAWALVAGLSEFVGGLLVAAGFLMPVGALIAMGAMATAILTVHYDKGFFSTRGGYEFPLLILLTMLALVFTGAGRFSVDALIHLRLPEPITAIVLGVLVLIGVVLTTASRHGLEFWPAPGGSRTQIG